MTHLLADGEVSAAYVELRERVVRLLRSLPEDADEIVVPHCPLWTVAELASHLMGVNDDIVNGRLEGVATDEWTQAQVERHRGKSLHNIADEFEALAERFDPLLPHIPAMARSQMTMDAVTHEHDLRHAVGHPGARDSRAVKVGVGWIREWIAQRNVAGSEPLLATGISDFDLLRCLTGRRSERQVSALGIDVTVLKRVLQGSPRRMPTATVEE